MQNASGIHPTEYKVLIAPKEVEQVTPGGIIIPNEHREKQEHAQQEGVIVEVSPIAFEFELWPQAARKPEPGDRVLFAKYAGFQWEGKDGKPYRIVNDKDVTAILD